MTRKTHAGRTIADTPEPLNTSAAARGTAALFCAILMLSVAQQIPFLLEEQQDALRLALFVGVAAYMLRALTDTRRWMSNRMAVSMVGLMVYVLVVTALVGGATGTNGFDHIIEIAIPTGLVLASIGSLRGYRDVRLFCLTYVSAALTLAITIWLHYGISTRSVSAIYLVEAKNQIGPIFGSAAVMALVGMLSFGSSQRRKPAHVILCGASYIFLFTTMVGVRNRAGVVALSAVSLVVLLQWLTQQRPWIQCLTVYGGCFLGLAMYIVGAFNGVAAYLWDSMTLNHDVSNINGLSSGRLETYRDALAFIGEYPLLGASGGPQWFGPIPHNFVINKWVELGVLGSLPIIVFYMWLWLRCLRAGLARKTSVMVRLAAMSLLFILLGSLLEYKLPMGPGVSTASTWVLLGAAGVLSWSHSSPSRAGQTFEVRR